MAQDDITAASEPALPSAPILLQSIIVQEKSSLGNNGKFEKSIGVKIKIENFWCRPNFYPYYLGHGMYAPYKIFWHSTNELHKENHWTNYTN